MVKNILTRTLLVFIFLNVTHFTFSQKTDSAKNFFHFGGAVLVTNNGISLLPTLSLGKPAAIFDLYMGKRKLSFEPEFRFSLEGKPWSFIFWWRYKLLTTDKFRIGIGAHPAVVFRTEYVIRNGDSINITAGRRYLATEVVPNYFLSKNISTGMYYLYSHGIDEGTTGNTHFLTLNSSFSNIKLSKQLYMRFTPQVYYLKLDEQDGFYFTASMTVAKRNFPLSVSAIINKTIDTHITVGKDFVWNASLVYSFNKTYVER